MPIVMTLSHSLFFIDTESVTSRYHMMRLVRVFKQAGVFMGHRESRSI